MERLQKYLARCGVGARRKCEELIKAGRVCVDGTVASIGATVEPERQRVTIDGIEVSPATLEYWLLNKPTGVICAVRDPRGRPTVTDLVRTQARIFPVGRLDWDSSGLVILTNDGELAFRLTHPRYEIKKTYVVRVRGFVSNEAVSCLSRGVALEDGLTAPAEVKVISRGKRQTALEITIHEGRNRQVRRMIEAVGYSVSSLHRSRIGTLTDEGLPLGHARRLAEKEVRELQRLVGLS